MTALKKMIQRVSPLMIRSERHSADVARRFDMRLVVEGVPCEIVNISESGVAFQSSGSFRENQPCEVHISINESERFYQGKGVVRRINASKSDGVVFGLAFTSGQLSPSLFEAYDAFANLQDSIASTIEDAKQVKESFKLLTFEIREFLQATKTQLDKVEEAIFHHSQLIKETYFDALNRTFAPHFVETLKSFSRRLDSEFTKVEGKELRKIYVQFFRREVGEYYTKSVFIGRALHKPRGYAGDYEMMNQIYRNEMDGRTFFECLIHKYGINEFSSLSVRYRKNYLMKQIAEIAKKKDHITVGSVACGPAREIVEYLDTLPVDESHRYTFVLIDQDTEALMNARRNVSERVIQRGLRCEVFFLPLSVKNILEQTEEAIALQDLQFDLLYTAGLYDYLTQPVAQALSSELLKSVKMNGMLIVGNFHPSNPTKTISELVADWRLIHRTSEDMLNLVPDAAVSSKSLHYDDQEIDVFLEVIK